jgi:hypothetical protein
MTTYRIEQLTEQPDRVYVEVDRRFIVVIERNEDGLALHVYPRTKGQLWDASFTTFEVDNMRRAALEGSHLAEINRRVLVDQEVLRVHPLPAPAR